MNMENFWMECGSLGNEETLPNTLTAAGKNHHWSFGIQFGKNTPHVLISVFNTLTRSDQCITTKCFKEYDGSVSRNMMNEAVIFSRAFLKLLLSRKTLNARTNVRTESRHFKCINYEPSPSPRLGQSYFLKHLVLIWISRFVSDVPSTWFFNV